MEMANRLGDKNIWRIINTALLVCIGLGGAGHVLGIGVMDVRIILTALITILTVLFMDRADARGRLMGVSGIGAVLSGVCMTAGFGTCVRFAGSYGLWLIGRPGWQSEWTAGYEVMQTVVLVLLCYLSEVLMEKNFRLKITGAAALLAGLLYALFAEKEMSKPGVAFFICYLLLTYAEWTQRRWKKEKGRSVQAYMLWVCPFVAVYFVMMMFCAVPKEPYEWRFVKKMYRQLTDSFQKISQNIIRAGNEDYELNLNGFSERGEIGGGRLENERELMRIWDADGLKSNVYLSGNVYDTFDGRQWWCRSGDTAKERYLDTVQTMYAARSYDSQYVTDYVKYASFRLEYRYFHSRYLFAPLKTANVIYKGRSLAFGEEGGSLFFDKAKGYGTEYEVSFYQLNAGQEAFDRFLCEAGNAQAEEEIRARILRELVQKTGVVITADDMAAHRQQVYACYTEEAALSEAVQAYVDEITEGAETDTEKLRRIEEALAGYTYTLRPGALPGTVTDSSGFLDYFLLDAQEGYCSHFATAFVLLARAQGFPARYVQGFCVPIEDGKETTVTSDMAHAWPEVYLDGIGWIPYEPTPGYRQVRYTPWALRSGSDSAVSRQGGGRTDGERLVLAEEVQEDAKEPEQTIRPAGEGLRQIMKLAGITLLFTAAALLVIGIFSRLLANYRYRRMNGEEKLRTKVRRNMQVLSLLGITRGQETLQEFRVRAEDVLADRDVLQFLEIYEGVLYGNDEVSQEMLDKTQKQQEELLLLLQKKKRLAYVYCRFFIRSR